MISADTVCDGCAEIQPRAWEQHIPITLFFSTGARESISVEDTFEQDVPLAETEPMIRRLAERRQRRGGMAGSQQGMGTGPRFGSATTAVVRDKTWPIKRKGLVEVLRRRRPSVYSGSTPEIEIVRARSKEAATQLGGKSTSLLAQLGLRLPRMQLGSMLARFKLPGPALHRSPG